ncbi:MAG: TIGR02679 domain-containing protein [Lachnospiraceae bacterium]|nr:TIGR02679 domain-containing protein [Lachnospiraceae bacterium]
MKQNWKNGAKNSLERECLEYFRSKSVFDRILCGFREKYRSYGSFSGTVTLRKLSEEELEDLEGFFQKNYHGKKSVSVSASGFEKAFGDSRFGEITPKRLLELYFQEEMVGKKEQKQQETEQWRQIFAKLESRYRQTPAQVWIDELKTQSGNLKTGLIPYLAKRYRESGQSQEEMEKTLYLAADIINTFPCRQGKREYLAVFAAMMTGNPHAFDDGTKDGQLLYLLIQWMEQTDENKQEMIGMQKTFSDRQQIFPALKKQRQYLETGILRDDVSNYVMISGIRAWKRNGELHAGIDGFCREGDMVQIPLGVAAGWSRVSCPENTVYIVENPSVYAMLCRKWQGSRACMCTNGQPRLSALLLLDLLAEAGVRIFYAGDFDPEGLLIAQKLKRYYPGEFICWHMSPEVYEQSRSDERISEKRLKMLDRITDEELLETAAAVRRSGLAGYQENIWGIYLE